MNCVNINAEDFRFSSSVNEGLIPAERDGVSSVARNEEFVRRAGVVIADRFYGISSSGRMTAEALKAILSRQSDGSMETRVHPGFVRADLLDAEPVIGRSSIKACRELEPEALLDPSLNEAVRNLDVQLFDFSEL